ncbi:hypothetical protein D3C78_1756890 [compost metagenome]
MLVSDQLVSVLLVQPTDGVSEGDSFFPDQLASQCKLHVFIGIDVQLQDERAIAAGYLRGGKMYRCFLLEFPLVELAVKQMLAKQIRIAAAPFHGEVCSR